MIQLKNLLLLWLGTLLTYYVLRGISAYSLITNVALLVLSLHITDFCIEVFWNSLKGSTIEDLNNKAILITGNIKILSSMQDLKSSANNYF